jgi:diguanylate cyclase (GGDEF)-like protein
MKKTKADDYAVEVSKDIRKLLLNALKRKGWYFFKNPNLLECWMEMGCEKTDCPSYKSSNLRCWQVAGTFCNGVPQGTFAKKFGDCQKCRVYKKATGKDVIFKIGEDFNNLMYQLKIKEDELRLSIQQSEAKNSKLAALNKKIESLVKTLDKKNTLLRELSLKDGLTGLYNYRFFREILHEQYHLAKRFKFPLSCVMIDIDYFKAVNDTYGHQLGDSILSQLADILRKNVRDADKVVRYGGEEFVIILPYTDGDAAYIKAERLRQLVSDHAFSAGEHMIGITVSLGIAAYPDSKRIKKADQLVSFADKALYQAKELGRNQSVMYTNGAAEKKGSQKVTQTGSIMERRKHPRIQTLIKVKGGGNGKESFSGSTFDISYSGLCLLSSKVFEVNRRMNIKLNLPDMQKKRAKAKEIEAEGLTVWCKQINDSSGKRKGNTDQPEENYLVGIQFLSMSKKDGAALQKYFVSLFKE